MSGQQGASDRFILIKIHQVVTINEVLSDLSVEKAVSLLK